MEMALYITLIKSFVRMVFARMLLFVSSPVMLETRNIIFPSEEIISQRN